MSFRKFTAVSSALSTLLFVLSASAQAQTVTLDDFESGMRTIGGHKLWDVYTGEGSAGTTAAATSAAKEGSQGLRYDLTAGTAYLHFFVNDGTNWDFAHNRLVSGNWTTNTYNRMSFWVFHPANFPARGSNRHNIELGTYVRCSTCDPTTQNAGGTHYYHYYDPEPGVWTYVVVDNHPQHAVGAGTGDPGVMTVPTSSGSSWNYFDALTRFYWNAPYDAPTSYPASYLFDGFKFYRDSNANEDVANIASIEASYNPTTNKLHVGFTRTPSGDTSYTAVYAFSDIWSLGFNNATALGSVGADGQGDYVNKKIESTTVNVTGKSVVYIAVQKQGSSVFRQIALPLTVGSTAVGSTPPAAPAAPTQLQVSP